MQFQDSRKEKTPVEGISERSARDSACAVSMIRFRLPYFCNLWLLSSALVFSQWSLCVRICKLATWSMLVVVAAVEKATNNK
jgi:hypothetical protein